MLRSKFLHDVGLAGLAFFSMALPALAGVLPIDALPLPNRVANAEMIVIGKVTGFEDKTVAIAPFPGAKNKVEYKIAVITISDALLAPKGVKTVRLGFVPPPAGVFVSPPPFQATIGMEGCFFLTKQGEGDFQVLAGQLGFLSARNVGFEILGTCPPRVGGRGGVNVARHSRPRQNGKKARRPVDCRRRPSYRGNARMFQVGFEGAIF